MPARENYEVQQEVLVIPNVDLPLSDRPVSDTSQFAKVTTQDAASEPPRTNILPPSRIAEERCQPGTFRLDVLGQIHPNAHAELYRHHQIHLTIVHQVANRAELNLKPGRIYKRQCQIIRWQCLLHLVDHRVAIPFDE